MKRKHRHLLSALILGLVVLCHAMSSGVAGESSTKEVSLADLPAAAQKTIQSQLNGGKVGKIEREIEDGDVSYSVTLGKEGKEHDMTVAEDGRLVSVEIALEETPAAVQKAVQAEMRGGTLDSIQKTFDEDNTVTYEIDSTTRGGADHAFTLSADG